MKKIRVINICSFDRAVVPEDQGFQAETLNN